MCLVLALSAVAVAFVSGPSLYAGISFSVFRFQDLLFIMKDCVHVMCEQDRRCEMSEQDRRCGATLVIVLEWCG